MRALLALGLLVPATVLADATQEQSESLFSKIADIAVPDSPAAAAISANPDSVLRPSTPREFAASLLRVVDRNGKADPGVAFEVMPVYLAMAGRNPDWARGGVLDAFATSTLSFATSAESGGEKAKRLSVGYRLLPWDPFDPRRDKSFGDCLLTVELPRGKPGQGADLPASEKDKLEKCYAGYSVWNRSHWAIAFAQAWRDVGSEKANLERDSRSLWTNLTYGFHHWPHGSVLRDNAMVALQARATRRQIDTDKTTADRVVRLDSDAVTLRAQVGTQKTNVSLAATFERRKWDDGTPRETGRIFAFGFDQQIVKGVWLTIETGAEGGDKAGKHSPFTFASIKYALDSTPQFGR